MKPNNVDEAIPKHVSIASIREYERLTGLLNVREFLAKRGIVIDYDEKV
jgi:hypothetical protein